MSVTLESGPGLGPHDEPFMVNFTDGTQLVLSIPDLDNFYQDAVLCCIQYASQIGASLILLIVLVLLTKPDRRLNPLFLLNSTALALNVLRMLLACIYFAGPFNEVYNYFSGDLSTIPVSAYAASITSEIFTALLAMVVLVSLLLQVQVICVTLRRKYRLAIIISSSLLGGLAVSFRSYLAALNIQAILNPNDESITPTLQDVSANTDIISTATIFWFCAIFVGKLGYALYSRRRLGLRRWGSMQVIFIMGCETLFIPAIFSIIQHNVDFPALSSFVLTLVAISLPLSALWASATLEGNKARADFGACNNDGGRRKMIMQQFGAGAITADGNISESATLRNGSTFATNGGKHKEDVSISLDGSTTREESVSVDSATRHDPLHDQFGNGGDVEMGMVRGMNF